MNLAPIISPLLLLGCAEAPAPTAGVFAPVYLGVQASLLADDLVQISVEMSGARDADDVTAYADCAAADYALYRGNGFARHLRTNVQEKGGMWFADAVYTISPSLPAGLKTIDAEVTVAACAENGIPTV